MNAKTNIFSTLILIVLFSCNTSNQGEPITESLENAATENAQPEEVNPTITPHHYICYKADDNSNLAISIAFDEKDNALSIQYKGQDEAMDLTFLKDATKEGSTTIEKHYKEMYEGKENGVLKLTHAGNYDYAEYTRGKDGKVFKFTIDHDLTVGDGGGYRTSPCYGPLVENSTGHLFSNHETKDRFKVYITGDDILTGTVYFVITNAQGEEIHSEKFASNELFTYDAPQDALGREKFIKDRIANFFKEEQFQNPALAANEKYDEEMAAGLDKGTWTEIQTNKAIGFSRNTSYGSIAIAYSKKQKKTFVYHDCC